MLCWNSATTTKPGSGISTWGKHCYFLMRRKRLWRSLRLTFLLLLFSLLFTQSCNTPTLTPARSLAKTRGYTFNYVEWEVDAILGKLTQELFGFQAFIPDDEREQAVLEYFALQNHFWTVQGQIEQVTAHPANTDPRVL